MSPKSTKNREEKRLRKKRRREERRWWREMWYHTTRSPPPANLGQRGSAACNNLELIGPSGEDPALLLALAALKTEVEELDECMRYLGLKLDAYGVPPLSSIAFEEEESDDESNGDTRPTRGELWECGGDAIADAQLCKGKRARNDPEIFRVKYGLLPEIVLKIKHQETIDVLNIYAETITSASKVGSDMFRKLFRNFVELFEKSGYEETYLDGEPTEVTDAYKEFLGCIKDEVTEVERRGGL